MLFTRDEVFPKVNESIILSGKAFAAGEVSVISLLKAQSSVMEAKISYYNTLLEHRHALLRIEDALGCRLEDAQKSDDDQQSKQVFTNNANSIQER